MSLTVSDADTAIALRSGNVPVLGTPRVLALCEEATVAALDGHLEAGQTTVGMRAHLDHLAPTAVGASVRAEAVVEELEGPRITFKVSVQDSRGLIAVGRITRVVVNTERFLDKLR